MSCWAPRQLPGLGVRGWRQGADWRRPARCPSMYTTSFGRRAVSVWGSGRPDPALGLPAWHLGVICHWQHTGVGAGGGLSVRPRRPGPERGPAEAAAPSCSEPRSLRGRVGCGGTGARGSAILAGQHNRGRCITCFPVSPGETWTDPPHPPGPSSPGLR